LDGEILSGITSTFFFTGAFVVLTTGFLVPDVGVRCTPGGLGTAFLFFGNSKPLGILSAGILSVDLLFFTFGIT
jgi:hypothetical protein